MGRGYKKYMALVLCAALIFENQVMTVSAATADFDSSEEVLEILTEGGDENLEVENDDEGLFIVPDYDVNPDEVSSDSITDEESLDDNAFEEDIEEELEADPDEELEDDLTDELEIDLEKDLEEDAEGQAKPMLSASTLANVSGNFEIEDGVLVKYFGTDEDVVIPDGVVEIGHLVFAYTSIKSVKLPESVKVIVARAFEGCKELERINLENVEKIGEQAFLDCRKLESINLENVEQIENHTFMGCSKLESINLENVEQIGDFAFADCSKLENVNLGKVVEIGVGAFGRCRSLKNIELPDSLEKLGSDAFAFIDIPEITIPKGTVCEAGVFCDSKIRQLYFEDGTKEIPEKMLEGARIKHIYIPSDVTSIGVIPKGAIIHGEAGSYAKEYAKDHDIRFFNNNLTVYYKSTMSVIDGGSTAGEFSWSCDDEYKLITVDEKGEVYGGRLRSCNISATASDGVVVGNCAVTVVMPDFLIEDGILTQYHGKDEDIVIPDGVVEIGRLVFMETDNTNRPRIKSVKLPESVKVIDARAFEECKELERINLENVEKIGEQAFLDCRKLESINLENVEQIGDFAFAYCSKLENVNLGKVVEIGVGAFGKCRSLKNIELPDSLEKLGSDAFAYIDSDTGIPKITIPKGTVCEAGVFCESKIRQLYFEDGTKEIPEKMLEGARIKHIYIPNEVTSIGVIPKGAIIHGEAGSYAKEYAKDHDIRFFNSELSVDQWYTASVIDGGSYEGEFTWWCENEDDDLPDPVASVDEKGVVYGRYLGESCKIYAKDSDGIIVGCCIVTVTQPIFMITDGILSGYTGTDEDVVIPDGVVEIYNSVFKSRDMKSVKLPDSVKIIDGEAFSNCKELEYINLENVEEIGYRAFEFCGKLENVNLSSAKEIGYNAFESCGNLKEANLSGKIGEGAFRSCEKLENVNLSSVKEIGRAAFIDCKSLKNIELPDSLEKLEGGAFGNIDIPKITIPKGTVCEGSVFSCSTIGQLYFEEGTKEIAQDMLGGGVEIKHLYIPKEVTTIGEFISSSPMIHGEPDSYAHEYAKEHRLRFFNNKLSVDRGYTASVIDGGSHEGEFTWESGDESIVTVDEKGVVYGKALLSCKIYARDSDGIIVGCCIVTVTQPIFMITDGVLSEYNGTDEDVVIPDGVVEIYNSVFKSRDMKSVKLPDSVKIIDGEAFSNCKELEHINLENVEEIGDRAFEFCGKLENVNLSSAKEIGYGAFESCGNLKEANLSGKIGERAFESCEKLENVNLSSVKEIGEAAFIDCKSLKNIELPDSLEKLEGGAFGNIDIPKITIPKGTVCEGSVFSCSTIGQLYFEEGTKEIAQDMLGGGVEIKHLYIPKEVTTIGEFISSSPMIHGEPDSYAHEYAKEHGLRFFNNKLSVDQGYTASVIDGGSYEGEFRWSCENDVDENPFFVAEVDQKGVVFGKALFMSCKVIAVDNGIIVGCCIVTVTQPTFIIQDGILFGYTGTDEDVVIPDGVVEIYNSAFKSRDIKSVKLPDSVKIIDGEAFSKCKELEHINLENVEEIGYRAFESCGKLENVNLSSAKEIGEEAFQSCGNLKEANLIGKIGEGAFRSCEKLENVNLSSVKEIGRAAFIDCKSLKNIELPDSLEKLEGGAFGFIDIPKITIPKGTVCEGSVFGGSTIGQLYFEEGTKEIAQDMLSGVEIKHLYIPKEVTTIGESSLNVSLIHGETGSYAHEYAKEHGRRFFNSELSLDVQTTKSIIDFGSHEGEFTWWCENENVYLLDPAAIVDEKGVVYGRYPNETCKIYAKDSDGIIVGCCVVNVTMPIFLIENDVLLIYTGTDEDVVIPDGVVEIYNSVFKSRDMKSVKLPDSVKIIDGEAFSNCKELEHINLENVEEIGDRAFEFCGKLENVNLSSAKEIGYGAFESCGNLKEANLSGKIGERAFESCEKLENVNLSSVKEIGEAAFIYCKSLKNIKLPDSLEKLEGGAFGFIDIPKITIPKGTVCEGSVFGGSTIGQLYFEEGTKEIPQYMLSGAEIKHLYIPKEVTTIGEGSLNVSLIHGETGSYAHEYAKEHRRRFFNSELSLDVQTTKSIIDFGSHEGEFTWESGDEAIATVDGTGTVYACSQGVCNIYAMDSDGEILGQCAVTVFARNVELLMQPASVEARIGDKVKFSVLGDEIASYQWYYSKDGGETWTISTMKGADTDTITIYVTDYRLGQMYRCQVTGMLGGTAVSDAAAILPKREITVQPEDIAALNGETIVFSVEAAGAKQYQWYYSLDGGESWNKSTMAGNKTKALTIQVIEKRINQKYKCLVKWYDGSVTESDVATILSREAFEITRQPEDIAAAVGGNAVFEIEAVGAKQYQWYFSQNGGETWSKSTMTGSKTNKLTVPVIEKRIGQMYRCQITGRDGKTLTSDAAKIVRASEN